MVLRSCASFDHIPIASLCQMQAVSEIIRDLSMARATIRIEILARARNQPHMRNLLFSFTRCPLWQAVHGNWPCKVSLNSSEATITFSQGSNGATSPPQPAPSLSSSTSTSGAAVSIKRCPYQNGKQYTRPPLQAHPSAAPISMLLLSTGSSLMVRSWEFSIAGFALHPANKVTNITRAIKLSFFSFSLLSPILLVRIITISITNSYQ